MLIRGNRVLNKASGMQCIADFFCKMTNKIITNNNNKIARVKLRVNIRPLWCNLPFKHQEETIPNRMLEGHISCIKIGQNFRTNSFQGHLSKYFIYYSSNAFLKDLYLFICSFLSRGLLHSGGCSISYLPLCCFL